ncbi:MAG: DUF3084 domain-containing protein [Armatimonadetes bacterium]|nr:DUF3084 domain-containing protein [Armatimonadota bacterium]
MSYTITVTLIVLALSGVIAYIGDLIGRRMGKKRLSVLGLRPRHTAIVLTILTGMAIAVGTLLFLSALEANVRVMLTQVPQIRRELRDASTRTQLLQDENQRLAVRSRKLRESAAKWAEVAEGIQARSRAELAGIRKRLESERNQLQQVRDELRTARAEANALALRNATLEKANRSLERDNRQALQNIEDKRHQIANAQRILKQLSGQVATYSEGMAAYRAGFVSRLSGKVIFRQDEELVRGVIEGGQPVPETLRKVRAIFQEASRKAEERRAKTGPNRMAVAILPKRVQASGAGKERIFSERDSLEAVAAQIADQPGGTLVRVVSRVNALENEPVPVDFELFQNRLVFAKGNEIAQTRIDGRQADAQIMQSLVHFLQDRVRAEALHSGLIPSSTEAVGEIAFDRLFDVMARIKQAGGTVDIRAVAGDDIWVGSPLAIEFEVGRSA